MLADPPGPAGDARLTQRGIKAEITADTSVDSEVSAVIVLQKLRPWELALLLALCVTLLAGLWADRTERHLADQLVRLHVVANSDSPEDQAEKLRLRDRALAVLAPLLADCGDRNEAVNIILSHRDELEALGDVSVSVGREYFPTRQYDTFSLPAGEYTALRLTIGRGAGQNWWCVVFPPLCTEALAEADSADAFLSLDEESADLIAGQDRDYDLRFRIVEWWGMLKERLG